MTGRPDPMDPGDASAAAAPFSFRAQIATLWTGLSISPERWRLLALAVAILTIILLTAAAQVALNAWNAPFYNAIAGRDMGLFLHELVVFFEIAGVLLVLNVVQMWLSMATQLQSRAGLMHDLLDQWLVPMRAFNLRHSGALGLNPDQRLHEDTRHFCELSTTLAIGLLQATVLLAVFVVVLWQLSAGFAFKILGHTIAIPGYMVWAATIYALAGSMASWRVGRSLIRYNASRYGREAELRYSLVRISDQIDTIALQRGEAAERRLLDVDLGHVLAAMRKLVIATTNLTWVTAGYGWLTQVVPLLVAAPAYFSGHISFGALMMAVGAFNQVQSSLRWFVDNFGAIADWRATLFRVASFRRAILIADDGPEMGDRITIEKGAAGHLILHDLAIASPGHCTCFAEGPVSIESGERVLITGDSGDAQTVLFHALAGLWPWGSGVIRLPGDQTFMHVARRPYVPPGRLRDVLAYPADAGAFEGSQFAAALEAASLGALVPRLEETARWEQELGEQDLQCLAFARLPLHKPQWIVIDQALDTLDENVLGHIRSMFETTLKDASIVATGRAHLGETLFARTLKLIDDPLGCRLPDASPGPAQAKIQPGRGDRATAEVARRGR